MFERFTPDAREVVIGAQNSARGLRSPQIGSEHLLISMLEQPGSAQQLLAGRGLTAAGVEQRLAGPDTALDPEALATLGIDLEQVRRAAEEQFGPGALRRKAKAMPRGHIPFSVGAKKVLELSLRAAVRLDSASITSVHLLIGLLDQDGRGRQLISESGVDLDALRVEAERAAGDQAA